MKVTNEMIQNYDGLVRRNCHGEVLLEVAQDFKLGVYIELFKSINKIHDLEGSLRHDVLVVRDRFRQEMKECLKHQLETEEYQLIARFV